MEAQDNDERHSWWQASDVWLALPIAACLTLVTIYLIRGWLRQGYQVYPEFVAGYLAFTDYFKTGEQRLFIAAIALFFFPLGYASGHSEQSLSMIGIASAHRDA